MKLLKFKRNHLAINGGEVAGFPDAIAAKLVGRGVAEYVNKPEAKVATAPAPPAPDGDVKGDDGKSHEMEVTPEILLTSKEKANAPKADTANAGDPDKGGKQATK